MQTQQWLEKLFASIDARETKEFVGFLTEDASFRYGSNVDVHGRPAIAACVDYVFTTFRASSHQLLRHWDTADCRIAQGVVTYTRLDDRKVSLPFCNVLTMHEQSGGALRNIHRPDAIDEPCLRARRLQQILGNGSSSSSSRYRAPPSSVASTTRETDEST